VTPQQMVDTVCGSAALEGHVHGPEFRAVLLKMARGELTADEVIASTIQGIHKNGPDRLRG